jgi:hypothetical protein
MTSSPSAPVPSSIPRSRPATGHASPLDLLPPIELGRFEPAMAIAVPCQLSRAAPPRTGFLFTGLWLCPRLPYRCRVAVNGVCLAVSDHEGGVPFAQCKDLTRSRVKRWRHGEQVERWAVLGLANAEAVRPPGLTRPQRGSGCGRVVAGSGARWQRSWPRTRRRTTVGRAVRISCTPPCDQRIPGSFVRRFETSRHVDSTMPDPKGQPRAAYVG